MSTTSATTLPFDVSATGGRIGHWYRDPLSCLQSTLGTLLIHAGEDPLAALGLAWEFIHIPGDFRPEEFYWPCRHRGDPARSMLPHHSVSSQWRIANDSDSRQELADALAAGRLPIIVVDNYHLPFRPAYRDLHSIHLIVVYDIDSETGIVKVSDAQPPAYAGPLDNDAMWRSWHVESPRDSQNVFFSGVGVGPLARWLDVQLDTPFPELDAERLHLALRANLHRFHASSDERRGLNGLRRYNVELVERARHGDANALVEAYTFGWGMQAQAALHGELLRERGVAWQNSSLAEAGRRVETVAHRWSALRIQAGHGRTDPAGCADELVQHARRLYEAYEVAMATIGRVTGGLPH